MYNHSSLLLSLLCLSSLLAGLAFQPVYGLEESPPPTPASDSAPTALVQNPYADLAIGVRWEDLNIGGTDYADTGVVHVLYGSASGMSGDYDQLLSQNDLDNPEQVEGGEEFGDALAYGDLNRDGWHDLVVGAPGEDVGNIDSAGIIQIYNGSASGMALPGGEIWHQDVLGIQDSAEAGDRFGDVLATGDFNGDGCDDIAVGTPYEDVPADQSMPEVQIEIAGAVHILYGSHLGIATLNNQFFYQTPALGETLESYNYFGHSLATGDFNGDGYDDLAIGVPYESLDELIEGVVHVLYGSQHGLSESGALLLYQDLSWIEGVSEAEDQFGNSLASGDFNGSGRDDLAIGVPGEDYNFGAGVLEGTGVVHVLFGDSPTGFSTADVLLTQSEDSPSVSESEDSFGTSLAAGWINGDQFADLVVGVPDEDVGDIGDAGAINIFYGAWYGIDTSLSQQMWHSDPEGGYWFGYTLALADFNADGYDDLAVGVPGRDISWNFNVYGRAGSVLTCPGSADGISSSCIEWHQGLYIQGTPENNDDFGLALAAAPPIFRSYLPAVMK